MTLTGLRVGPFEIVEPTWVPEPGRWYLGRADSGDDALIRVGGGEDRASVDRQHQALLSLADPRIPSILAHDDRLGAIALGGGTGTPLTDAIAQRVDESIVLTPATLIDLVQEVARGVAHAQSRGRVHGWLDADRVLLAPDGQVRIFGYGADGEPLPAWASPERTAGLAPTAATDVWSIGALALALVLGHPPFRSAEESATGDCTPLAHGIGEQWPALGRVLVRALAPDPDARYPDAAALLEALDDLAAAAGPSTDRAALGETLWTRRSLTFLPSTGGAPTVVPATDSEEERELSEPGLGRRPPLEPITNLGLLRDAPRETPQLNSVIPRPMLVPEDATLGESHSAVRAPFLMALPPIQRLAPFLAGAMVVLGLLWLLARLF